MNSHFDCKKMREEFLDLAQPGRELSAEAQTHMRECAACAAELAALRQTWSAMDTWQAPEPSVYFDSRLQARFSEEIRHFGSVGACVNRAGIWAAAWHG